MAGFGALSLRLSFRAFRASGFTKASTVADVISAIGTVWPQCWMDRCLNLNSVRVPPLLHDANDQVLWINHLQVPSGFAVSEVWQSLIGVLEVVPWYGL